MCRRRKKRERKRKKKTKTLGEGKDDFQELTGIIITHLMNIMEHHISCRQITHCNLSCTLINEFKQQELEQGGYLCTDKLLLDGDGIRPHCWAGSQISSWILCCTGKLIIMMIIIIFL